MSWASPAFSFGGMRHIFRSQGSVPFLPESAPPFPLTGRRQPPARQARRPTARESTAAIETREPTRCPRRSASRPRSREGISTLRRRARRDMSFHPVICPLLRLKGWAPTVTRAEAARRERRRASGHRLPRTEFRASAGLDRAGETG